MKGVARVFLLGLLCLGSDQAWSQMLSDIRIQPRIFGPGFRPAPNEQFGSVVAIFFNQVGGKKQICSGTLLTSKVILTAGHCGCGVPHSYSISVNQDARRDDSSQLNRIDGAPILFDQRVCRNGFLGGGNDLALIKLANDVALNGSVNTGIGYPPDMVWDLRPLLVKGTKLTAVGYGVTSANVVGTRGQGNIPIQSFGCEERTLNSFCAPFAEMILAEAPGPTVRTDTCGGDSGGPVFRFVDGVPHLVAVTSRAAPGSQDNPRLHCGGGGIYTLVGRNSVHQWLQDNGVPESRLSN